MTVKRYKVVEIDEEFGLQESTEGYYITYSDYQKLVAENAALKLERNKWKPEVCPVSNRPFFMWINHPDDGMVPTYGGPYDSYTIPTQDSDGEFICERFDHDEGAWVDSCCLSVRIIDDQLEVMTDAAIAEIKAQGVDEFASAVQGGCAVGDRVKDLATLFAANVRAGRKG